MIKLQQGIQETRKAGDCSHIPVYTYIIYTTLLWVFKGTIQAHILPGQCLDITWAISLECGLLIALMTNQFKDTKCFDSFY